MTLDSSLQTIGSRYQVLEKLDEGGMGAVYRAADRLSGQTVALKQVAIAAAQSEDQTSLRYALTQEFTVLSSLRHPNIISVLDYGFIGGQPYFTLELLENAQTIVDYARGKPLTEQVRLLVQMLQALAYLHQRDIIHHDLKPSNVMIVGDQVKVLDFGLASAHEQRRPDSNPAGTLYYMAPELFSGSPVSVASDLYAVGVIIYELLTGMVPFHSTSNKFALMYKIVRAQPDEALIADSPLRDVILRLLQKSPSKRYASAADVIAALCDSSGYPRPSESSAVRESFLQAAQFVGREAEFGILLDALDQASAGHGSTWLVGGESGVGKSRLLDELRTQALIQGALVLRGQAVAEGGTPYQIWRDALRTLLLDTPISDEEASLLKPILPDLDRLLGREVADPPPSDAHSQQRRLRAIMEKLFEGKPLTVLLLEDLHWADESLQFLNRMIELSNSTSLLIVGTYRDDERHTLPAEFPSASHIELSRLPPASIAQLSQAMLGEAGRSPAVLDLLERETEGNVYFIVEVVRALAEDAGSLANIGRMTLPGYIFAGGIESVTRRRLERVPESARHLLSIAAVMGRVLDPKVLHQIMPDVRIERWLQKVSPVVDVQDNRYRFAHDKLREATVNALDPDDRRAIHGQIAQAIEAVYPDSPEQYATLAYHWGASDNPDAEARYALLAAAEARQLYAYTQAAAYYLQALNALLKLPDTVERRSQRVDATMGWVDVSLVHLGPAPLLERLTEAEQLARSLPSPKDGAAGDRRRLAHIQLRLGHVYFNRNSMVEASRSYLDVLAKADEFEDQSLLTQPAGVIGRLYGVQGRYRQTEPLLAQAVPRLAEIGDWDQWGVTMVVFALTKAGMGNVAEGLALFPEINARVANRKDYARTILCNTTPCLIHLTMTHDIEAAAQFSAEAVRLLTEYTDLTATYIASGYAMWLESRRGNHKLAREWMEKAEDIQRQAGSPLLLNDTFVYAQAELSFNRGDYPDAFERANKSMAVAIAAGSAINQVRTHSLLARIFAHLEPHGCSAIDEHFTTALALCEANDMRIEAANLHAAWGQVDKSPVALDHLEKAAAQFAASNLPIRLAELAPLIQSIKSEQ